MIASNLVVSSKLSRWNKEIVSWTIGVISDSSGKNVISFDTGPIDQALYEKWNAHACQMLNLANVFNAEGTEDARPMTADELQTYLKEEEEKKTRLASLPDATAEDIDAYFQRWIDDCENPDHMEATLALPKKKRATSTYYTSLIFPLLITI